MTTTTTAAIPRQSPPAGRPPASAARGPVKQERVSVLVDALAVLAVLAVWLVAQLTVLGGLSEHRAQVTLYGQLRGELASATAPTGGVIPPGAPVALVVIPSLGVEHVVVEGTASGDLLSGPGHRRDTVLPGQEGTAVLYGRAHTFGAPFANVADLRSGQEVVVRTAQGRSTYRVTGVRRAGDPLPAPLAPGHGRLTLVTGDGSGRLAALTAGSTVYVDATLVGKPFAAPPGRLTAVPAAEHAMGVDTSSLPLLVVCLAALGAVVAAAVMTRRRWHGAVVWLVTVPVVVALAWATTDVAVRLLPNLL